MMEKYEGIKFIEYNKKLAQKVGNADYYNPKVQEELDKTENMAAIVERAFGKPNPNKVPKEYDEYVKKLEYELTTSIPYPQRFEEKDAFASGQKITDLIFKH